MDVCLTFSLSYTLPNVYAMHATIYMDATILTIVGMMQDCPIDTPVGVWQYVHLSTWRGDHDGHPDIFS